MQTGATRKRHVTGGGGNAAKTSQLRWVNTMLGNPKTALAGTYHSFDHARYVARYLAEFAYRFNRRFNLAAMLPRLLRRPGRFPFGCCACLGQVANQTNLWRGPAVWHGRPIQTLSGFSRRVAGPPPGQSPAAGD